MIFMPAAVEPALHTTLEYVHASRSQEASGGYATAVGSLLVGWNKVSVRGKGLCAAFDDDGSKPLPSEVVPAHRADGYACLAREAVLEWQAGAVVFTAGKKPVGISQALLTGPATPTRAGLTDWQSPDKAQEGVWLVQLEQLAGRSVSLAGGVAFAERQEAWRKPSPYVVARYNRDVFDISSFVAQKFVGVALSWQSADWLVIYGEGNVHQGRSGQLGNDPVASDFLFGMSGVVAPLEATFIAEYARTSSAPAGRWTVKEAGRWQSRSRQKRETAYLFPLPVTEERRLAQNGGYGNIFARDLVLVHAERDFSPLTLSGMSLFSANDGSSNAGLSLTYANKTNDNSWKVTLGWRHFAGTRDSWYGRVARSVGAEQFWLNLTM